MNWHFQTQVGGSTFISVFCIHVMYACSDTRCNHNDGMITCLIFPLFDHTAAIMEGIALFADCDNIVASFEPPYAHTHTQHQHFGTKEGHTKQTVICLVPGKMNGKLQIPCHYLDGMSFGMYSNSEIVKLSVKEVVSSQSFDQLGHPTVGGLYDPALGTADMTETCKTCGLGEQMCPGHMGHIKLVLVCYNPAFFKLLHQVCEMRLTESSLASRGRVSSFQTCGFRTRKNPEVETRVVQVPPFPIQSTKVGEKIQLENG